MIHDFTSASGRTGRRGLRWNQCRNGGFDTSCSLGWQATRQGDERLGDFKADKIPSRLETSRGVKWPFNHRTRFWTSVALPLPNPQHLEGLDRVEEQTLCRILCSLVVESDIPRSSERYFSRLRGEPLSDRRTPWAPRREASPFRVKSPGSVRSRRDFYERFLKARLFFATAQRASLFARAEELSYANEETSPGARFEEETDAEEGSPVSFLLSLSVCVCVCDFSQAPASSGLINELATSTSCPSCPLAAPSSRK